MDRHLAIPLGCPETSSLDHLRCISRRTESPSSKKNSEGLDEMVYVVHANGGRRQSVVACVREREIAEKMQIMQQ